MSPRDNGPALGCLLLLAMLLALAALTCGLFRAAVWAVGLATGW